MYQDEMLGTLDPSVEGGAGEEVPEYSCPASSAPRIRRLF